MQTNSKISTLAAGVLIVTLFAFVAWFQVSYDRLSPPFTTKLKLAKRNLLPPQILPYMTFGFNAIAADFYWIRAIQDFVAWNGKEGFFIGYFKNIAALDPRFEYPYLFSILTIPQTQTQKKDIGALDAVAVIAEKGIEAIHDGWQIPFYLGTQYFLFTKDYTKPEHYLSIAASKKSAPSGVYLIYTTFAGRASPGRIKSDKDARIAQSLLKVIHDTTDNETTKKIAAKGIEQSIISNMVEKAIFAYKAKTGRYPDALDELAEKNYIKLPEAFQTYFTIIINKKTGAFRIEEKE